MKLKTILFCVICVVPLTASSQIFSFSGELATELEWDMNKNVNWVNFLRLEASLKPWRNGSFDLATLHVAKTDPYIIDDYQVFSNIYGENLVAAIAVLGYMHTWEDLAHVFFGVRNMNEDFFVSDMASLFTNSSPGIFPTIGASYDIANFPVSALTLYFDLKWKNFTLKNSFYNGVGHNGWNNHNNPFMFRPKKDGVFNITEISYEWDKGSYFTGVAVHSKHFDENMEGDFEPVENKASCAWYIYGEQNVWENADNKIGVMAQFSINSKRNNACRTYAEVGSVWEYKEDNQTGLSFQYADFLEGKEYSIEATYLHAFNDHFSFQPALQFIHNNNGNYTPILARLYVDF